MSATLDKVGFVENPRLFRTKPAEIDVSSFCPLHSVHCHGVVSGPEVTIVLLSTLFSSVFVTTHIVVNMRHTAHCNHLLNCWQHLFLHKGSCFLTPAFQAHIHDWLHSTHTWQLTEHFIVQFWLWTAWPSLAKSKKPSYLDSLIHFFRWCEQDSLISYLASKKLECVTCKLGQVSYSICASSPASQHP